MIVERTWGNSVALRVIWIKRAHCSSLFVLFQVLLGLVLLVNLLSSRNHFFFLYGLLFFPGILLFIDISLLFAPPEDDYGRISKHQIHLTRASETLGRTYTQRPIG